MTTNCDCQSQPRQPQGGGSRRQPESGPGLLKVRLPPADPQGGAEPRARNLAVVPEFADEADGGYADGI
ncbi:MAG TPA: hypothetical protein VKA15_22995, partial [Isosphaeraceae bacterium]|nr:hypothetical protein [Isosphaeraceae bacterium]